ncbi:hypothetical protein HK102_002217, partial [Quaeritorhiza haematococci]
EGPAEAFAWQGTPAIAEVDYAVLFARSYDMLRVLVDHGAVVTPQLVGDFPDFTKLSLSERELLRVAFFLHLPDGADLEGVGKHVVERVVQVASEQEDPIWRELFLAQWELRPHRKHPLLYLGPAKLAPAAVVLAKYWWAQLTPKSELG